MTHAAAFEALRKTGGLGARWLLGAALLAAALGWLPAAAHATAMFASQADATLTIVEISGGNLADLKIDGTSTPADASGQQIAFGNATASSTGFANIVGTDPANLRAGDSLVLQAKTSGSASIAGAAGCCFDSFASADLFNNSAQDTFVIKFTIGWSLSANASIADPATEDAATGADVFVDSSTDTFVDQFVESDVLLGPFGPQSLSDTQTFFVTLAPGVQDFVEVEVSTGGFAVATAEPGSAVLLAAGLMAWAVSQRRRRMA